MPAKLEEIWQRVKYSDRESNILTKSQISWQIAKNFPILLNLLQLISIFIMWAPHYFFCPPFSCCLIEQKKKDCIALKPLCSDCFGNVGSNNHIMNPIHRLYVLSYLFTCISIYDNSSYIDIFVGFPPLWSAKDCIISSHKHLALTSPKEDTKFCLVIHKLHSHFTAIQFCWSLNIGLQTEFDNTKSYHHY